MKAKVKVKQKPGRKKGAKLKRPSKLLLQKALQESGGIISRAGIICGIGVPYTHQLIGEYDLVEWKNEQLKQQEDLAEEIVTDFMQKDPHLAMKYLSLMKRVKAGAHMAKVNFSDNKGLSITVTTEQAKTELNTFIEDDDD